MTIKELIENFEGKSIEEIVEDVIYEKAEIIAKEDGIYYEWQQGGVTDNEYEEYLDDVIIKLYKEYEIERKV